ncbi:MAG: hypothetical protein HYZ50_11960 [Deltaproteobacteria bacterium]|nr:hypothetical protein [Deltaproteobacteria bacterium]
MSMKKLLAAWGMALTLVSGNVASVWAVDFFGSVGCEHLACLDVYKVKCTGPTRSIYGEIRDNDADADYVTLTLTGLAPGPTKGKSVAAFVLGGGLGAVDWTSLFRDPAIGAMQGYATVGNAFGGSTSYALVLQCYDNFNQKTPTTATQIQDQ